MEVEVAEVVPEEGVAEEEVGVAAATPRQHLPGDQLQTPMVGASL